MTGASTNGMSGLFGSHGPAPKSVTLPYDSLQDVARTPDAPGGAQAGFYPPVNLALSKKFDIPAEWEDKLVLLEFEGVYTNSMVYINGDYAGGCLHGYSNFYVEANRFLKFGQTNEVRVTVATANDTRWYNGAGIYRNVKLLVSDLVHIVPDSYRVSTPEIDEAMTNAGDIMSVLNDSELVTSATKESYDVLDLCGYNYAPSRYELDKKLFPNRVLVGSETAPMRIAGNWEIISRNPHAVGEFTWTGMDYLGEAGIGKQEMKEDGAVPSFTGSFPWHLSRCGDIDITGQRRPMSYYREIVFGLRTEPYIAVDYPQNYGKTPLPDMWSSFEALSSWSWNGYEGKPVRVNVFGTGDRFQLLVNGQCAAEGPLEQYRGVAELSYTPGELAAVTYNGQEETGRTVLRSAEGPVAIRLEPDRREILANDSDLCYVEVSMTAANGEVVPTVNPTAKASVAGSGILLGFGSSEPKTEERFRDGEYTARDGRLLAVIRPTAPGSITLTVEAPGFQPASVEILAR